MIEIPGLRRTSLDDFKDPGSNLCTQQLRNQTKTPNRAKWLRKGNSKQLGQDFNCVGWEDNGNGETSPEDICLLSWLESRALDVSVGNSNWNVGPEWEKFLSVDIKSRCKALKNNQDWMNLRLDLNNRAITDVEGSGFTGNSSSRHSFHSQQPKAAFRAEQLDFNRSSTSTCLKKRPFDESRRQESLCTPPRKSSPSQSFVEDQRQKSIRLATIAQPRPLTHATDNLKPADVDSNAFRRHFLKSSQSSSITDPSHIPKDRYQEFSRKQSRKQRRSLRMTDDGESPEPCNGKNLPDHMQAYRRRKLEQNVVKIKEANFVTPCETSQSTANILQPKKPVTRSELDSVENKIYVQKYTDVSFLQKNSSNQVLDRNNLAGSLCQVHGIKKDPTTYSAEVQVGRPLQVLERSSAPKLPSAPVALDFISADIASEKAALDSLHLLQSLEKKRRGKPIKTRLLGTDKIINPSSPDLAASIRRISFRAAVSLPSSDDVNKRRASIISIPFSSAALHMLFYKNICT